MGPIDKLTEPVAGEPLLRRTARRAVATRLPVLALVAPDRPARLAALKGLHLRPVAVPDAAEGMARSIRAGLTALPSEAAGAMMLMADMPALETADLLRLVRRFEVLGGDTVVRAATEDGLPGSPAIVPRRLFPALSDLSGDTGGRSVLKGEAQDLVRLEGQRAVIDLDTPEDWDVWRLGKPDE